MKATPALLLKIYRRLHQAFGHHHWWPGDSAFEVIVGAILTQNTSWKNVEKAIQNLKKAKVLNPKLLSRMPEKHLAQLIRPAGYFNIKARRLKNFLNFLNQKYGGSLSRLFSKSGAGLRQELLEVNGIGPETADSILLYAGQKPFFVVDAYTKRIFFRHHFFDDDIKYSEVQDFFMKRLPPRAALYNDYHAQLVKVGNTFCHRSKPKCSECPLNFLFDLEHRIFEPPSQHTDPTPTPRSKY